VGTVNVFLTVTLIAVILYILFRPGNQSTEIIHAIGGGSRDYIRTLSGQYPAGNGYAMGGY
jgi:hypothetical protein